MIPELIGAAAIVAALAIMAYLAPGLADRKPAAPKPAAPERPQSPVPEAAIAHLRTQPIAVNLTGNAKLDHAAYRLDAIRRYIEQTESVAAGKCEEFLNEIRELGTLLKREGRLTEAQFAALEAMVKGHW